MTDETEETKKKWEVSGLFIPAGLFIGMGIEVDPIIRTG